MKARTTLILALSVGVASVLTAHDLFIKLERYFVNPNSSVLVPILNGTFALSENAIMPDRVLDVSVVSAAGRSAVPLTAWVGDTALTDTTFVTIETGDPGTYIVGVSTRPRELDLAAADFNEYLEHDGIPDVLDARRRDGELERDVRERYAKHVKAVLQVGDRIDAPSRWWQFWKRGEPAFLTVLGYPAEIVPLTNPYALQPGDELSVRCLVDGVPVADQLVIVGGERGGAPLDERSRRTDAEGMATFVLDAPAVWYVKFITMTTSPEVGLDYESKWATLTFATR